MTALVFMLLLLVAASVVAMAGRQNDRDALRGFQLSSVPSSSDMFLEKNRDIWRGQRIDLVWIEPAGPSSTPTLPRGVRHMPRPGEAVVSPALDELATSHPELARRYPHRSVLSWDGVRTGGELIAFVRPAAGRRIGGEEEAVHIKDGRYVGHESVLRVSEFGGRSWVRTVDTVDSAHVAVGASALAVVPGLIVLAVGVATGSRVRDRRLQLLGAIGASRRTQRTIGIGETLLLALPGLLVAVVGWALASRYLLSVPIVGYRVVPGDLVLPGWALAAALLAAVTACAVLAGLLPVISDPSHRGRPTSTRTTWSPLAAVPLVLAGVAFGLAHLSETRRAADLNLIGIVLAVAGTPMIMPGALRALGASIGGSKAIITSLVGRGMEWDPKRASRPFVGLGTLIVLVLAGAGYAAVGQPEAPPEPHTEQSAVLVQWREPAPEDLETLRDGVGDALVLSFREEPLEGSDHQHVDHGPETPSVVTLGAGCDEVTQLVGARACGSGRSGLTARVQRALGRVMGSITEGDVEKVELEDSDRGSAGSVVVLDNQRLSRLDERVRTAAVSALPAPNVLSAENNRQFASPVVAWVLRGAVVAAAALALGCLTALVDRVLATRPAHRNLLNQGLVAKQLTHLGALTFAIPFFTVAAIGLAFGLVVCVNIVNPGFAVPWLVVAGTAASVLAVGILGSLAVASLGAREALRERE